MARPKAFLKAEKAKKKHPRNEMPQDADDILAEGVEFEEAGEKWRAGDGAKSMRFFHRALDMYSRGLQKFPQNLDLAYNKARIQYEMATHPVLISQLQVPLVDALNDALASHQYALQLDQDNPDTLFNTAQVLTSIAEEIAKDDRRSDDEAIQLLEQALQLFRRCLDIQEIRFAESQSQVHEVTEPEQPQEPPTGELPLQPSTAGTEKADSAGREQWASIVEPVTKNTLLDTALAQVSALTTLTGLLSPQNTNFISQIEDQTAKLLNEKIPVYSHDESRASEIALAKANLISALLDSSFRATRINLDTYQRELDAVFSTPDLQISTSSDASISKANALMSFTSSLADTVDSSSPDYSTILLLRWQSLSSAIDILTRAAKIPAIPSDDLVSTHLLRGDISLLQHRLGELPDHYGPAASNAAVLLKNATTFYRNASKLAAAAGRDLQTRYEAQIKSLVSSWLSQAGSEAAVGGVAADTVKGIPMHRIQAVFTEIVDDGLVRQEVVEGLWQTLQQSAS